MESVGAQPVPLDEQIRRLHDGHSRVVAEGFRQSGVPGGDVGAHASSSLAERVVEADEKDPRLGVRFAKSPDGQPDSFENRIERGSCAAVGNRKVGIGLDRESEQIVPADRHDDDVAAGGDLADVFSLELREQIAGSGAIDGEIDHLRLLLEPLLESLGEVSGHPSSARIARPSREGVAHDQDARLRRSRGDRRGGEGRLTGRDGLTGTSAQREPEARSE